MSNSRIVALVLAGGLSSRMGDLKVLLPWGDHTTILDHIVQQLYEAGLDTIVVVTGHRANEVGLVAGRAGAISVHNPDYAGGDMLSSLQSGLRALPDDATAALIALGDQPQIQTRVVIQVLETYAQTGAPITAPSFNRRRGHPYILDQRMWPELLSLPREASPRALFQAHAQEIAYVTVDDDSILRDIDTPDVYAAERRRAGLS